MWEFLLVVAVALLASALTLFSGFGLGTLLLPAFALVFPLHVAIGATAVVHLANNLWKGALFRGDVHWPTVLRFGLPALLFAMLGAWLLGRLPTTLWLEQGPLRITALGVVVGLLIVVFALFDLIPRLKTLAVDARHLSLGGALSGFFGGLSGHQGAMRSVFLTKLGLGPAAFVATGTLCAVLVDVSRLAIYGAGGLSPSSWPVVAAACAAAFLGAVLGKKVLGKVTIDQVRTVVGVALLAVGSLIVLGLV